MQDITKINLISAEMLRQQIDNNPDLIMINVLSEKYYNDCHIKGSIHIAFENLLEKVSSWDKDKDIVVYCATSTCDRSKKAYQLMQDLGFVNLSEYAGGIKEWFIKGYETSGSCALPYLHEPAN